ncbi:transposable element Tcb2 transposase [Trichonephila clavipes]|nr:transposable element Tcb2 transposase [Trichonephila clavipes]
MAGNQDLNEFERGVIVGAQEMGHSIFEFYVLPGPVNTDDWKHVARSDKSRFQLNRADGSVPVWKQFHEIHGPYMSTGDCSSWRRLCDGMGRVQLAQCGTPDMSSYDSDRCVSILSDYLHPFMSIVYSDGFGEFQQDKVTPHQSRIATSRSRNTYLKLDTSARPPKSPDMNIIEHISDALQHAF